MNRMSAAFLSFGLGVCFFSAAYGAAPQFVGAAAGDGGVYFVKSSFKQVDADIRSGHFFFDYKAVRYRMDANYNDDHTKPYYSLGQSYFANCTNQTIADSKLTYYSGHMEKSQTVGEILAPDDPRPSFYQPLTLSDWDGITRKIFNTLCASR